MNPVWLYGGGFALLVTVLTLAAAVLIARQSRRARYGSYPTYTIEYLTDRYPDRALITEIMRIKAQSETSAIATFWALLPFEIPPANSVHIVNITKR